MARMPRTEGRCEGPRWGNWACAIAAGLALVVRRRRVQSGGMAGIVAILEDHAGRIAEMRACLGEVLPGMEVAFFEDAGGMIEWLGQHLSSVVLISLDHDLPLRDREGQRIDCGTGRQVADYLAARPPSCPVIVHSSNEDCASGMFFCLKDAGWSVSRVRPWDEEAWVRAAWIERVRKYVQEG